jgi:hypothetical protein
MSEQKTVTLTVPYHEDPVRRADGALWDGIGRTGAAKDGRSIAVLRADIGKALLASWPGEPAGDYAKRLAEIETEVARRAKPLPFYYGKVTAVLREDRRDDLGWLLGQLRATSDALRETQAELAARADPNGTWAKLDALAGKVAGIVDEVDMSAGADSTSGPLTASLPLLNIEAHGATAQELAEDLVDQLRFVWRTYGCADVDTLTQDARRLRDAARALFAADAAKPESEDMSEGADFTPDPPRFTGSKEATIAKLAEVDPALAADVARANGVDSKG